MTKTNAGVEMVDLSSVETQELVETVGRNKAVVIMAPPQEGPANKAVSTLLSALKAKQVGRVGAGWAGLGNGWDGRRGGSGRQVAADMHPLI